MWKRRNWLLFAIAAVVSTALLWPASIPLQLQLAHIESADVVDDSGNEMRLWTLSITNTDSVWLEVEKHPTVEFEADDIWVSAEQELDFGLVAPAQHSTQILLLPADAMACRLRVNYRTEPWNARLLQWLGDSGRRQLIRLPWLANLLWTDQWNRFPGPPRWQRAELTVDAPLFSEKNDTP